MPAYYKLIGRLPVPCADPLEWAEWFGSADRTVMKTEVGGLLHVSTVFLGLDHSFREGADPVLFETMIFDEGADAYQTRCGTWDEAEAMHAEAVAEAERRVTAARNATANPR